MMLLSIIIVTYNSAKDITNCLDALEAETCSISHEIFLVDNNSNDDTVSIIREKYPNIHLIINNFNAGFPGGNNQALRKASGEYLFLLNPDTVVLPGSVLGLLRYLDRNPQIALCGPRLVDGLGKVAPDIFLPTLSRLVCDVLFFGHLSTTSHHRRHVDALSGAALMFRREVIERIGLLDEKMFWREDVDYSLRAQKAGFGLAVDTSVTIVHLIGRSASTNQKVALEKPLSSSIRYFMKHHGKKQARLVWLLLYWQTILRLVKWIFLQTWRPSPEGKERVRAFRCILGKFPSYFQNALELDPSRDV